MMFHHRFGCGSQSFWIILRKLRNSLLTLIFASILTDLEPKMAPQILPLGAIFCHKSVWGFYTFVREPSWSRHGRDMRPKTIPNHIFIECPSTLDRLSHMLVDLGCLLKGQGGIMEECRTHFWMAVFQTVFPRLRTMFNENVECNGVFWYAVAHLKKNKFYTRWRTLDESCQLISATFFGNPILQNKNHKSLQGLVG